MLKLLLDVGVLALIMQMLQGEDSPEWAHLFFVALGMAVANFVITLALVSVIGFLVFLPIVIVDGLILMFYCSMSMRQAAIALAILFVYNIAFSALWAAIF